jgi:2-dehydro-3-deoxyphosphogluconate aldolase/(4S)-4-hydroxy-2-oxoglutarate aldolase
MARFMRLDVIISLLETGVLPLFYHGDLSVAVEAAAACTRGGASCLEFTNRGELAYPVFCELVRQVARSDPAVILGAGSIVDAPTAALYLSAGANFIVGPNFNPEIARLCNRRKVLYIPGCATENEIAAAEELGAEICKVFPADAAGGPGFIKAVMAPCPWRRLLPTGGVEASEASISQWIQAGAAAVGLGSGLVSSQALRDGDFAGIAAKTTDCIAWVRAARRRKNEKESNS